MVITETPPHAETKTTYNHQPLFSWDTSPETMVCVHARIVRGQFLKGHCLSNCAKCHICDVDLSMAKNVLCIDPTCPKQGKELCFSESSMFRSTFWSFLNWGFEYCWHLTIQRVARQYLLFQNAFKAHVVIHCCTNHDVFSMKCSFFFSNHGRGNCPKINSTTIMLQFFVCRPNFGFAPMSL